MSQYEKVVSVIKRDPKQRADFDIAEILPYVRKRSKKLFEKIRTDLLKDIIRNCEFKVKQRDEIIIKQGDEGDCFYVVLSGSISIYIHNQDRGEEEEKQELKSIVQYKDGVLDRARLGTLAVTLGEGESVGEVALIDDTKCIRTASVVANTETDLMVVDKPTYNRCAKDVLAREFEDKKQFISGNPLFASWAPKYRKQLTMAMYKEVFPYDGTLVRQGDEVEFVYFILRGQVEIQIDSSSHPHQYPKIFAAANENEAEKLLRKSEKMRPPTEVSYQSSIRKRDNSKSTRLCYLGINESVGDLEMTMDLATYMQTAVCKEVTEVLVLERKHYERLFVRRHPRTIEAMRQQIGVKLTTRKSLLSCKDEIPFLGHVSGVIESRMKPPQAPEKERQEPTVSEAEREFLNHKGPLIDLHGPGSVFHLIKVREKSKLKMRASQRYVERPHALRGIPSNMLLTAKQLVNGSDDLDPDPDPRPRSARDRVKAAPMSFRRIKSAHQDEEDDIDEKECMFQAGSNGVPRDSQQRLAITDSFNNSPDSQGPPSLRMLTSGLREGGLAGGGGGRGDDHARLSMLEERIRQWLSHDNPRQGRQVTQLRRLSPQEMEQQPHPGNKVVLRRRQRPSSGTVLDGNPRAKKDDRGKPFKILLTNS